MDGSDSRFWEAQARRYDRAVRLMNRRIDEVAARAAQAVAGAGSVLEVASGTGLVTIALAETADRLVATDTSPSMLSVLRGRLAARELDHVEVRRADALALPFDDGEFDAVVVANLLHLVPEPADLLDEVCRVVRPGGTVCAPTFCHGQHWRARMTSKLLALAGFPIRTRFSDAQLRQRIEGHSLEILDARLFPGLLPIWYVQSIVPTTRPRRPER